MKILAMVFAGLLLFIYSCGSDGDDDIPNTKKISPKFIDSPVVGLSYTCGDKTALTDSAGAYYCEALPIVFKIGNLTIGTLQKFTEDGFVFPQDILGLERSNFTDPRLIALIRLLQSLDDDGDISMTINIEKEKAEKFDTPEEFSKDNIDDYAAKAEVSLVPGDQAVKHLKRSYARFKLFKDYIIPLSGGLSGEYYPEWCEVTETGIATFIRYWKLSENGTAIGKGNKSETLSTKFTYGLTASLDFEFSYIGSGEKKVYTWLDLGERRAIFTNPDGGYLILHRDKTRAEAVAAGERHLDETDCLID